MTKKISVILPVRNEEKYISRCLDSILAQDYPSYLVEILAVDGMSDDGTRGILETYASKHKNIKIFDNPR